MHRRLPLYGSLSTMAVQVWGSGALGYATERASAYRRLPCGFMQVQPGVCPRAWVLLMMHFSESISVSTSRIARAEGGRWFLTLVCGYGLPPNVHTWSLHVCIHENLKNNSNVNRLCFSFNIGFFFFFGLLFYPYPSTPTACTQPITVCPSVLPLPPVPLYWACFPSTLSEGWIRSQTIKIPTVDFTSLFKYSRWAKLEQTTT